MTTTEAAQAAFSEVAKEGDYRLTKREYFAAHAPEEIPDWFEHTAPQRPEEPPREDSLPEHIRKAASEWLHDPCYDLTDWSDSEDDKVKAAFQAAHEENWKAVRVWRAEDTTARYFQWRAYYADQMIKALG